MPIPAADLPTAPGIAAIAAIAAAALLAVWLIPRRQRRRWEQSGIARKDSIELENSARSTLVQLFGGVALILTFVATWLQISDSRQASERTLRLTAGQQETEQFSRGVQQLGAPRPEVRIGGIYALQQAAQNNSSRSEAVAQLMLAYLKSNHPLREGDERLRELDRRNLIFGGNPVPRACTPVVRAWPDTQAALSVLLALPRSVRTPMDLIGVDLIGVRISRADFRGVLLRNASLAGAILEDANFDDAHLNLTDLRRTCLRNGSFARTVFAFANTVGADFSGADLRTAYKAEGFICGAFVDKHTRPKKLKVPKRCPWH